MTTWALLIGAYLLGSVPFGLWIGFARGVDLRAAGSGNIGATNAARALGLRFGALVLLLDVGKGLAPVLLAGALVPAEESRLAEYAPLLTGLLAVLGHVFPLYLRFRGGKGVATAAGVFLGLLPAATGLSLVIWSLVLLASRWVALASLIAAWSLPALGLLLAERRADPSLRAALCCALLVAALITLRHRSNIVRMCRGEEPKVGTHV